MIVFATIATAPTSVVSAQDVDQEAVRQAHLTLAAFECYAFAKDLKEQERLFTLGYEAGKAFIERTTKNMPNVETRNQIALLWLSTGGPTPDFILGQIFNEVMSSAYEDLGDN